MEERPARYANKPRTSARLRQHAARWAFACLSAVALALIAAMPLLAQPMPAFGASYYLQVVDSSGRDVLGGEGVDPDAVFNGITVTYEVPSVFGTDDNVVNFGVRFRIKDSSGAVVNSFYTAKNVRDNGGPVPEGTTGTYSLYGTVLVPGESYTVEVLWVTNSTWSYNPTPGTGGETVVATDRIGFAVRGQGDEENGGGDDEEIVEGEPAPGDELGGAPAVSAPDPVEDVEPADDAEEAQEEVEEEEAADVGLDNDAQVSIDPSDSYAGESEQNGSVRPVEGAMQDSETRENRTRASKVLQSAGGSDAGNAGDNGLALASGKQGATDGVDAEALMGKGEVRALKAGALAGTDGEEPDSDSLDLEMQAVLSLKWALLLALAVGAFPLGALSRLLGNAILAKRPTRIALSFN